MVMHIDNLQTYINDFVLTTSICTSNFIFTILSHFSSINIKIEHIFTESEHLIITFDFITICIDNCFDKNELINIIKDLITRSENINNSINIENGDCHDELIMIFMPNPDIKLIELYVNFDTVISDYDKLVFP